MGVMVNITNSNSSLPPLSNCYLLSQLESLFLRLADLRNVPCNHHYDDDDFSMFFYDLIFLDGDDQDNPQDPCQLPIV